MSVLEYHTADKSTWGPGDWQDEPDKMQWTDETTGYPCLMKRHETSGHLCGYVGVPPGHPFHEVDYNEVGVDGEWPDVHGGLTYAAGCEHGPEETSVCHVPAPGEPDDVWWLGFDCAHAFDLSPGHRARYRQLFEETGDPLWAETEVGGAIRDVYRNLPYVQSQCAGLAAWLKEQA